jgi:hypothetical protein
VKAPRIDDLPRLVDADARLVRRGRWLSTTFLLEVGTEAHLVRVVDGRVVSVGHGPFPMPSWTFALRAPADAWAAFWSPVPPPGRHDLFAMVKDGALRVEGDLHPFMANLLYFKGVLALLRAAP